MRYDVDIRDFLQNLKATKPPYKCPFENCGKLYKSYTGMNFHLCNYDHSDSRVSSVGESDNKKGRWHHRQNFDKSFSTEFISSCARESLTYAEAQKMVEFDIDGKVYRININEPLDIICVDGKNGDLPSSSNGVVLKKSCDSSNMGISGAKSTKGRSSKPGKHGNKNKKEPNQDENENNSQLTIPNLPEPSFRVIEDYEAIDVPERSSAYYRYIEKSSEEIEDEIEYDMDEEDTAWLDLVNKKRKNDGLPEVPADIFEILMDRLEKESYFQSQTSGKDVGPAIDEDAVCCICNDGECQNSNAILFCDMCNLAVHQECYGVPYIPEGQWLCRRCLQSPSRAVDCVLCPNKGGAFKQTDDNQWAHVVCALWIPEVCFANTVFLEPIDSINNIPSARWKLSCYICKQRNVGACIQCHKANCYVAFHVTCAQQAGLYMKMEAVKEMSPSGVVTNVRKAAYCDAHTPPDENGTSLNGVYSSGEEDSRSEFRRMQQTKAKFKEKMKKARKILAEKRSAIPVVSVPTIPLERLTKIALLINIPKRNQFVQLLLGYWTLKRQSRNGVPLLRRLQISHTGMRKFDGDKDTDDEQVIQLKEQLKSLQRLRQDLEKARLLVELIRKREKLKREYVKNHQLVTEMQLNPFRKFLEDVLSQLQAKDNQKIFAEPVNISEVADYLNFIKEPMDFSTMRKRILANYYNNFSKFEYDFNLIISNCMKYNNKDTIYFKAAVKLKEQGGVMIRQAKKHLNLFNEKTGLLIDYQIDVPFSPQKSPQKSVKEDLESKLKSLQEQLAKAQQCKSGGSKTKKLQRLTAEIKETEQQINALSGIDSVPFNDTTNHNTDTSHQKTSHQKTSLQKTSHQKTSHQKKSKNKMKNKKSLRNMDETDTKNESLFLDRSKVVHSPSSPQIDSIDKNETISNKKESRKSKQKNVTNKQAKLSKTVKKNKSSFQNTKKMNGTSNQLSNSTFASISTDLNNGFTSKKNKSPLKSVNKKKLTADASTCTPPNMFTLTAETFAKQQAVKRTKRRSNRTADKNSKRFKLLSDAPLHLDTSIPFSPASVQQSDSFRVYRNLNSPTDSDVNSNHSSNSTVSSSTSSSDSSGSSDSSLTSYVSAESCQSGDIGNKRRSQRPCSRSSRSDISLNNQNIPLQPLDLVWAKCAGYPWYPALIVNPDMPKTERNGILVPVPPDDVLAHRQQNNEKTLTYLVSFFDAKRTWQWLPRNKLEPLGVHQSIDQYKLAESRKAADRKAVKLAYEKAVLFLVKEKASHLTEESSNGI